MTAPSSAVLHQWQTSTDQSSLGGSSLVKPLFVHPAIKSSLRHAIKQILTRRAIETNYILWCACLCSFLFGALACVFVQYTMHVTQHYWVCYSQVYFSAFDVFCVGFLNVFLYVCSLLPLLFYFLRPPLCFENVCLCFGSIYDTCHPALPEDPRGTQEISSGGATTLQTKTNFITWKTRKYTNTKYIKYIKPNMFAGAHAARPSHLSASSSITARLNSQ